MIEAQKIVDPHHHLWDLDAVHYPWLVDQSPGSFVSTNPDLSRNYLLSDYLADAVDFDLVKSVNVEAHPDSIDPVAETAWLQAIADDPDNGGFPHGIVAGANLLVKEFLDTLADHAKFPNLRGIRQVISWEEDLDINSTIWRANFGHLEEYGLSFDLQITPDQMKDAAKLALDFPDIQIVLNHTGFPDTGKEHGYEEWQPGMKLLAECDNVSVKISGFGIFDPGWTLVSIRPFILETINLFGPSRCMFASDFPVDRLFRNFTDTWSAYFEVTKEFSSTEVSSMFHDNAINYYRL